MNLLTAQRDGWAWLKAQVERRDGGCIAKNPVAMPGMMAEDECRGVIEFDHVKESSGSGDRAPDDEAHGVAACSWHHRGSGWRTDSKEHRQAIRRYLRSIYPNVWGKA